MAAMPCKAVHAEEVADAKYLKGSPLFPSSFGRMLVSLSFFCRSRRRFVSRSPSVKPPAEKRVPARLPSPEKVSKDLLMPLILSGESGRVYDSELQLWRNIFELGLKGSFHCLSL